MLPILHLIVLENKFNRIKADKHLKERVKTNQLKYKDRNYSRGNSFRWPSHNSSLNDKDCHHQTLYSSVACYDTWYNLKRNTTFQHYFTREVSIAPCLKFGLLSLSRKIKTEIKLVKLQFQCILQTALLFNLCLTVQGRMRSVMEVRM